MTALAFDMERYLMEVCGHYHEGRPGFLHPRSWGHGVMPLWEFTDDHIEAILDACASPRRPPRYGGERGIFRVESRAWHEWHWTRGKRLYADPDYAPRGRRYIPDSLRLAVYERDGWACLHCSSLDTLSLDHIYPHSLGGEDTFENLQTLCRPCNSRKGAKVDG